MKREWSDYRQKCLTRARHQCEICDRSEKVKLQIHHPHYDAKLKPWEYQIEFCQVLCSGCHAREHGIIKPDYGWYLVHSDWDEEESSGDGTCELCGRSIKWHNILWHPQWGEIDVGYECADQLGNPDIHEAHKRALRRRAFVNSPRWRKTERGLLYRHGDVRVFICDHGQHFSLKIGGKWGELKYSTVEEAKSRAARRIHCQESHANKERG